MTVNLIKNLAILVCVMYAAETGAQTCELKQFAKGDNWGFKDKSDQVVIPAKYEFAGAFSKGLAPVSKTKGLWGYINCNNEYVITPQYGGANPFTKEGLAVVQEYNGAYKSGKNGVINMKNDTVIPIEYYSLGNYGNLFCGIKNYNDSIKILFNSKAEMIGMVNNFVHYPKDSVFMVVVNNSFGLLNHDGEEILPPICDYIGEGYVPKSAYGTGTYTIYNRPLTNNGAVVYSINKQYGVIDRNGKHIIELSPDILGHFIHGLMRISRNGKYGYMNESYEIVIPCIYDDAMMAFNGKYITVRKDGKYGFIDKKGNPYLPFKYDEATSFSYNGLSKVRVGSDVYYIDEVGNKLTIEPSKPTTGAATKSTGNTPCKECIYCKGKGKTKGAAQYEKCATCRGTGYFGYTSNYQKLSTDRSRYSYYSKPGYSPTVCTSCKGTGKQFAQFADDACNFCQGSGCEK